MIDIDKSNGLWTVTLNRPDKANALTAEMLEELVTIAEDATEARGFILTGTSKVFSAGADMDAAKAGLATSDVWERLSSAIAMIPCLTIAALNGTLAGGANGMALACDIRIAVPTAKIFYPVMKLGYRPQPSDPIRMSTLIGPSRTKLVLMAGQKITAQDALTYGLIDKIVEPDNLIATAQDLLQDSVAADPLLVQEIKAMID